MARALVLSLLAVLLALTPACGKQAQRAKEADAFRELGLSYLHEGNSPGAIEMFMKAEAINPKDARIHHELGLAFFEREMYPEAEEEIQEALRLDPTMSEARLNLGSLYIATARYEDGAAVLEALVGDPLYRRPHRAYNNLGWCYYKMGRLKEAERAYKKALDLAPGFCQAHFNLGLLNNDEGDTHGTLYHFQKAAELCPNDARIQLEYAATLVRLDRGEEARPLLEAVAASDPDGELGQRAREYLQVIR